MGFPLSIAIHPNGRTIAVALDSSPTLVRGFESSCASKGRLEEAFRLEIDESNLLSEVQFSADGNFLIARTERETSAWAFGATPVALKKSWEEQTSFEKAVAFVSGEQFLTCWAYPGKLVLSWRDVSTCRQVREVRKESKRQYCTTVALSPDGSKLAQFDYKGSEIDLWDPISGRELGTWVLREEFPVLDSDGDTWLSEDAYPGVSSKPVFSLQRSLAAVGTSTGGVNLLDMNTMKSRILRAYNRRVGHVSFSPSGEILVSVWRDGTIAFWAV
jgi:WD40 repeat protein